MPSLFQIPFARPLFAVALLRTFFRGFCICFQCPRVVDYKDTFQFVKQDEAPYKLPPSTTKNLRLGESFKEEGKSNKSVVVNGIPLHTEQF